MPIDNMRLDDFNSGEWIKKETVSKLDPWKPKIDEWLEEDRRMRFKQRHTAKRVHHRLLSEYSGEYNCSYPLVQRYLKQKKSERREGGFMECKCQVLFPLFR